MKIYTVIITWCTQSKGSYSEQDWMYLSIVSQVHPILSLGTKIMKCTYSNAKSFPLKLLMELSIYWYFLSHECTCSSLNMTHLRSIPAARSSSRLRLGSCRSTVLPFSITLVLPSRANWLNICFFRASSNCDKIILNYKKEKRVQRIAA